MLKIKNSTNKPKKLNMIWNIINKRADLNLVDLFFKKTVQFKKDFLILF